MATADQTSRPSWLQRNVRDRIGDRPLVVGSLSGLVGSVVAIAIGVVLARLTGDDYSWGSVVGACVTMFAIGYWMAFRYRSPEVPGPRRGPLAPRAQKRDR